MQGLGIVIFIFDFELNLFDLLVAVDRFLYLPRPLDELLDWVGLVTDEGPEVPVGDRNPDDDSKDHLEAPVDEECVLEAEGAVQGRSDDRPNNEAEPCHCF